MESDFKRGYKESGYEMAKKNLLESVKKSEGFDKVLSSILERLYELPFETVGSCSGHVEKDNFNRLAREEYHGRLVYKYPHLYIEDDSWGLVEKQNDFKKQLSDLEKIINQRYARDVVKFKFWSEESGYLSFQEIVGKSLYEIIFEIIDQETRDHNAREILTIIWEEFWKYLGRFDGQDLPAPDFKGGDVFIKKEKK